MCRHGGCAARYSAPWDSTARAIRVATEAASNGNVADRGLSREHDRVGAVEDRGGHVVGFRPGRAGRPDHRLEHLRGHDHRTAGRPRRPEQPLLHERDLLHRQLHAEVATGHHRGVGDVEDPLEVLHRRAGLDLRHDRHGPVPHRRAQLLDVGGIPDEGLGDEVDAEVEDVPEHLPIAVRHGRQAEPLGRHVHPLVAADRTRPDAFGLHAIALDPHDRELHGAVGEQDPVPDPEVVREPRVRGRRAGRIARTAGPDLEPLTRPERERIGVHVGQTHLRPGEVGEDGERAPRHPLHLAHDPDGSGVLVHRAVRAVDPEDRGAGLDEPAHHLRGGARGAERADELRASVHGWSTSRRTSSTTARASSSPLPGPSSGSENVVGTSPPARRSASSMNASGSSIGEVRERAGHLREREGPRAGDDARPLVAAAAGRDPATAGGSVREGVQLLRALAVGAGGEPELRERIGRVRVASELGHEDVRCEPLHGVRHDRAERLEPRLVPRLRRQRHVDRGTLRAGAASLGRRAGARGRTVRGSTRGSRS